MVYQEQTDELHHLIIAIQNPRLLLPNSWCRWSAGHETDSSIVSKAWIHNYIFTCFFCIIVAPNWTCPKTTHSSKKLKMPHRGIMELCHLDIWTSGWLYIKEIWCYDYDEKRDNQLEVSMKLSIRSLICYGDQTDLGYIRARLASLHQLGIFSSWRRRMGLCVPIQS